MSSALLHEEMASLSFPTFERRRASGAARRVARELMNSMGLSGLPILRSTFGTPIWPAGVVGSMAHDDRIAVAAVGLRRDVDAVGIDIEPVTPLQPDMLELIATPRERHAIADNPLGAKLLFVIKEAVYKAAYPLDHEFLDFHDIAVDLPAGSRRPEPDARSRSTGAFSLMYWSWRRFISEHYRKLRNSYNSCIPIQVLD